MVLKSGGAQGGKGVGFLPFSFKKFSYLKQKASSKKKVLFEEAFCRETAGKLNARDDV